MKKLLLLNLLLVVCLLGPQINMPADAKELTDNEMNAIEQLLFNQTYTSSAIQDRLSKIEGLIYGQSFDSLSIDQRMEKISGFVPRDLMQQNGGVLPSAQKSLPEVKNDNDSPSPSRTLPPLAQHNPSQPSQVDKQEHIPGLMSSPGVDYLDGTLPPRGQTIFTEDQTANNHPGQARTFSGGDPYPAYENRQPDNLAYKNQPVKAPQTYDYAQNVPAEPPQDYDYDQDFADEDSPLPQSSNYPTVDEAELALFGKVFSSEDIYKRLDRIETKMKGAKQNGTLYDRVDNLSKDIKYITLRDKFAKQYTPVIPGSDITQMPADNNSQRYHQYNRTDDFDQVPQQNSLSPKNYYNMQGSSSPGSTSSYSSMSTTNNMTVGVQPPSTGYSPPQVSTGASLGFKKDELAQLEQQLFGRTYEEDLSMCRMDRIERKVMGKTTFGLLDERLNKVNDVMAGKRPAKDVITHSYYAPPPMPYGYNYGYNGYQQPYNNGYYNQYPQPAPYSQYNSYNQYQQASPYGQYNQYGQYGQYGQYNPYDPYGQYGYVPTTPKGVAAAAAGTAIDKTLGKKSGILATLGKAAGSAMMGAPMTPYGNQYMPY